MDTTPRVSPQQFADSMKLEMEEYLEGVMEAVNEAPDGEWIAGSEERVRDLSAEMRRRVFEKAVQQRIDAAEAAFPPSAPSDDGKAAGQQGPTVAERADRQRPDTASAAMVVRRAKRKRGAGR